MKKGVNLFFILLLTGISALMTTISCSSDNSSVTGLGDTDTDTDTDTDSDSDSDTDTDSDSDTDSDTDSNPGDICDGGKCSYIWIANSGESTLSKVNTFTQVEVARYRTCPGTGKFDCDPSRTSVNLHGDVVVTNRFPSTLDIPAGETVSPDTLEHSSVTKFAASKSDCIDLNNDGKITTSNGPDNVLTWGEDECMIWNRDLPFINGNSPRARATAWDGTEDPDSGTGGNVIIGTCIAADDGEGSVGEWGQTDNNQLYIINGDSGVVDDTIKITDTECFYGGAMDANGNFWIMDGFGFPSEQSKDGKGLIKVNLSSKSIERFEEHCGYGISVDGDGNVWTGGKDWGSDAPPNFKSCVQKTSQSGVIEVSEVFDKEYFRGIAVGSGKSEGFIWAVERKGSLYKFDATDISKAPEIINIPAFDAASTCNDYEDCPNNLVGVAIDYDGNVWSVSTTDNSAYMLDPATKEFKTVVIGEKPYTYSDMTGMQLKGVISID
ncbi:MAG: hypothetical protein JXR91_06370 [Deltaproteobacteria bacterium]|nr:hypothetical protein [Deltaproteobacteria bacterium]